MPHEFTFSDAVLPEPAEILGLTLKYYSIGHELILFRRRNHLLVLNGPSFLVCLPETQVAAIQNAVLVCSRSWEENATAGSAPPYRLWRWRQRKADHTKAMIAFLEYRSAGSLFPRGPSKEAKEVLQKEAGESGRLLGAPFLCRLYAFIAHLPEREIRSFGSSAWDFPMGFATFLYCTHLENEGASQIENEAELQVRLDWEKALAEIPADRRIA